MGCAPNGKFKDDSWLKEDVEINKKKFEERKARAPNFLTDPRRRHSISGTDETSSAFKVGSNRDLMEFYIFPRLFKWHGADAVMVCKAWSQWWLDSQEYVDDHPIWFYSNFPYTYWDEIRNRGDLMDHLF